MSTDQSEAEALDAELSAIVWNGQLDPANTPRIIWCSLVNVDYSYALPGSLWPDGRARVVVNRLSYLDVDRVVRQLAAMDTSRPGDEPPALAGGVP